MSLEPIGLATFLLGLLLCATGLRAVVIGYCIAALFGSAAAIIIGGANIQPGHVFVGFLAGALLIRRQGFIAALDALAPGRAGFWLGCLVAYGVISAFFLPRIFAGMTDIIPLGTSGYDDTGFTVPLGPVTSNLTQSIYMIGNVAAFALVGGVAATPRGFQAVLAGLLAYCAGNAVLAFLDIATYSAGLQDLLGFMRNAQYTLHTDTEIHGLKRIVGSFTEASSFARSTLGVLGFTATLWLCGLRPALSGALAVVSLALVLLSTSSTGLVGAPLMMVVLFLTALWRCGANHASRFSSVTVIFAPPLTAIAALAVAISPEAWATIQSYVELVVLDKGTSDSGIARSLWNTIALQNFVDTGGLGVGMGSVRTSSFAAALLANVGVIGTALFVAFAVTVFLAGRHQPRSDFSDVRLAARNGCMGLMLGDLLVSPVIDQGLFFYTLAALACALPEKAFTPQRVGA